MSNSMQFDRVYDAMGEFIEAFSSLQGLMPQPLWEALFYAIHNRKLPNDIELTSPIFEIFRKTVDGHIVWGAVISDIAARYKVVMDGEHVKVMRLATTV